MKLIRFIKVKYLNFIGEDFFHFPHFFHLFSSVVTIFRDFFLLKVSKIRFSSFSSLPKYKDEDEGFILIIFNSYSLKQIFLWPFTRLWNSSNSRKSRNSRKFLVKMMKMMQRELPFRLNKTLTLDLMKINCYVIYVNL